MIFLDTNVFVDLLLPPADEAGHVRLRTIVALCERIQSGHEKALVSEVVLHESFYVLVLRSKAFTVAEFCEVFRDILSWRGWNIDDREMGIFRSGLDVLEQHPRLEFSDSIIAARAEAYGAELVTSDARLAKAYTGRIWTGE